MGIDTMEVRLSLTAKEVYNLLLNKAEIFHEFYGCTDVNNLDSIFKEVGYDTLIFKNDTPVNLPEKLSIVASKLDEELQYPGFKYISFKAAKNGIRNIIYKDYFVYITISPEMLVERKYTNKIFMLTESNILQLQLAWAKAILTIFPQVSKPNKKNMGLAMIPYLGLLDLARVDYAINLSSNHPELALAMMCKSHRQKYTPIKAYLADPYSKTSEIIGFSQNTTYKHVSCYIKARKADEKNEEILREAREYNLIRFEVGKHKQDTADNFYTVMSETRSREMIDQAYSEVGYGDWYSEYRFNKMLKKAVDDGIITKHTSENIKQLAMIVSFTHNYLLSNDDFPRKPYNESQQELGFLISKLSSKTNMWTAKNLYVRRKELIINNKKIKGKSYDTYIKTLKMADELNLQLVRIPKANKVAGGCLENPFDTPVLIGENHQGNTYNLDDIVVERINKINDEYNKYAENPLSLIYDEDDLVFDEVVVIRGIIRENVISESNKICYIIADVVYGNNYASDESEAVRILGNLWGIARGDCLRIVGKWNYHRTYGGYINVEKFTFVVPDNRVSMLNAIYIYRDKKPANYYLAKDNKKTMSDKEFAKFLEGDIKCGEKCPEDIVQAWKDIKRVTEIKSYLQAHKLFGKLESYYLLTYKIDDISSFAKNPYAFANDLFDFDEIDCFALSELNFEKDNLYRIRAGYECIRKSKLEEGNTAWPYEEILSDGEILLGIPKEKLRIVFDVEARIIDQLAILSDHDFEKNIAVKLKELMSKPGIVSNGNSNIAIDAKYAGKQKEAIEKAVFGNSGLFVLTGGPGTGKTTAVNEIVKLLQKAGERVALVAPTGRAAERLSKSTGLKSYTLHKKFCIKTNEEGFLISSGQRGEDYSVLICDEMSMVSAEMFSLLLDVLTQKEGFKKLILVGDPDQLPAVEPGAVLRDICECDKIDVVNLTEVQRQSAGSPIITLANQIIRGEQVDITSDKNQDVYFVEKNDDAIVAEITQIVTQNDAVHNDFAQVLCCTNVDPCGTGTINLSVQMDRRKKYGYKYFKVSANKIFYIDDKVIQSKNDYKAGVMNGEIGYVKEITFDNLIKISFEGNDKEISYKAQNLMNIDLAYAISVHKSQGSEFSVVILTVPKNGKWDRNMLYTAVTRAKKKVVFVGYKDAINKAIKKKYVRITALVKYLN